MGTDTHGGNLGPCVRYILVGYKSSVPFLGMLPLCTVLTGQRGLFCLPVCGGGGKIGFDAC